MILSVYGIAVSVKASVVEIGFMVSPVVSIGLAR